MIELTKAIIHKYKSIENKQEFALGSDITVLVGMNESGKTSLLEALAKVNYFEKDKDFEFNMTHDFPRKQKKAADKSGQIQEAVTLEYAISDGLIEMIEKDILIPFSQKKISYTKKYNNKGIYSINTVSIQDFVIAQLSSLGIKEQKYIDLFTGVKNAEDFNALIAKLTSEGESTSFIESVNKLQKYFNNYWNWDNPIHEYIARIHIDKNLPKFMYYDDYYMLPSRISIDGLNKGEVNESSEKTAKALLELADIDTTVVNLS